jgi:hypothetical protein
LEKKEKASMETLAVKRYIGLIKSDFTSYYEMFYSRKAAPPICLALCSIIIIAYVFGNAGKLI